MSLFGLYFFDVYFRRFNQRLIFGRLFFGIFVVEMDLKLYAVSFVLVGKHQVFPIPFSFLLFRRLLFSLFCSHIGQETENSSIIFFPIFLLFFQGSLFLWFGFLFDERHGKNGRQQIVGLNAFYLGFGLPSDLKFGHVDFVVKKDSLFELSGLLDDFFPIFGESF